MSQRSLREQRREQRLALGRDQILDAAEQVFARNGYHDSSLREIAELAEYSVGAVYGFFASKEELYRAIFLRRREGFMPIMTEVLRSAAPTDRKLLELATRQVEFFRSHPEFGRLVLRGGAIIAPLADPPDGSELLHEFRRALDLQAELFRRGQGDGLLRQGDPQLLSRMFSGLVSAFQATELATVEREPVTMPLELLLEAIEAAFLTRPTS
jgi:TetR/AcrR family transcriptional regulator